VVKRGHDEGSTWLNVAGLMKARATCVISDTRDSSGTTLCWLHVPQQSVRNSGPT
jgi:hypothetical protein